LATHTRAEAVDALNAAGVPTGSVYTAEDVFEDPQVAARGMLMPVTDSEVGTYTNLGQHTTGIMREILGYDDDAIRALAEEKVIQLGV
jgi:crotonobetainyl-CoA:carnitine CoA-transferase CaiB-like acyl-CoA transferase